MLSYPSAVSVRKRGWASAMIKEITVDEEIIEIDLDGAPLWKIWVLHIVLFVRFGKLLRESTTTN